MTKKFKEDDFIIYNKSLKDGNFKENLGRLIKIKESSFTIELQTSKEQIKSGIDELEHIWTNDTQLEKIEFINYGTHFKLNDIIFFRPEYYSYNKNTINNIIFGNQLFVAKHSINNDYFDIYKKEGILDLKFFLESHIEVTLLLQLFDFLDSQNIKYNKEEIASYAKLRN